MPIRVDPAKIGDVLELATMEMAAFGSSEQTQVLYPGGTTEASLKQRAARILKEWTEDTSTRLVKAVDSETGELIGSARWHLYEKERPESEWNVNDNPADWGEGANNEACKAFFGGIHESRRRIMAGKPHLLLSILATHPDKQKRGAGTALVKCACQTGDNHNVPVYLESTPVAYSMYEKFGFKDVGAVVLDFKPYTGREGSSKLTNMIRQVRVNSHRELEAAQTSKPFHT